MAPKNSKLQPEVQQRHESRTLVATYVSLGSRPFDRGASKTRVTTERTVVPFHDRATMFSALEFLDMPCMNLFAK